MGVFMNNKIGRVAFSVMGKFEETVTMAMLTVTLAVTVVNVFARYIFTSSIPWAQEVTELHGRGPVCLVSVGAIDGICTWELSFSSKSSNLICIE